MALKNNFLLPLAVSFAIFLAERSENKKNFAEKMVIYILEVESI